MKIKSESLPMRCEICHQSDEFDAVLNQCRRCWNVTNRFNSQHIQNPEWPKEYPRLVWSRILRIDLVVCLFVCFLGLMLGLAQVDSQLRSFPNNDLIGETKIFIGLMSLLFPLLVGGYKIFLKPEIENQIFTGNPSSWLIAGIIFILIGGVLTVQHWTFRRSANTAEMIQRLKRVHLAQEVYRTSLGKGNYIGSIYSFLECSPGNGSLRSAEVVTLEMENSARIEFGKEYGYQIISYQTFPQTEKSPPRYELQAAPNIPTGPYKSGMDCFYLDETGKIRHSGNPERLADKNSEPIEENYTSQ